MIYISLISNALIFLLFFLPFNYSWADSVRKKLINDSIFLENLPKSEYEAKTLTNYLAKIIDKKGNTYFLKEAIHIDHGYAVNTVYVERDDKLEAEQKIYTSTYDPEGGGCYFGERKEILMKRKIDPNTIIHSYFKNYIFKTNIDSDQFNDAVLFIREQDCRTGNYRIIGFIISPQEEVNIISIASRSE